MLQLPFTRVIKKNSSAHKKHADKFFGANSGPTKKNSSAFEFQMPHTVLLALLSAKNPKICRGITEFTFVRFLFSTPPPNCVVQVRVGLMR